MKRVETLSDCPHRAIFDGICAECGKFVTPDSKYIKFRGVYILSSENSITQIERYLIKNKKLALIVDLDKTLIDAIRFINEEESKKIIMVDQENESEYMYFNTNESILIRLRPYLQEVLEKISPYFYMQVYTLAERSYALKVLQKIDPNGKYFNQRLLSREDSTKNKKSISDLLLSGQNMAVVIDDTRSVWTNKEGMTIQNLVQIKPFHFFPTIKNGRKIKNKLEIIQSAVKQSDKKSSYLKRMANVLTEIHSKYFEYKAVKTVPDIINEMKASVFKGCYLYFCSIWSDENIEQKKLYVNDAKSFGANVLKKFVPYVTHIITNNPNHDDVVEAKKYKGIYIVNYKWFVNSIFRYERQKENIPFYAVSNQLGTAPLITEGREEKIEPPNLENNNDLED